MKSKLIYLALLCILILSSCNTDQKKIFSLEEENKRLVNENVELIKESEDIVKQNEDYSLEIERLNSENDNLKKENKNIIKLNDEYLLEMERLNNEIEILSKDIIELKDKCPIDDNHRKRIKDSYNKIGYIYYLKTNLFIGISKEEVSELIKYDYVEVLPALGNQEMWRFDILANNDYKFEDEYNLDILDIEGLKEEVVGLVLFISWDNEEKLSDYTFYYKEPVDESINEYRVFDNGTVRESIISQ